MSFFGKQYQRVKAEGVEELMDALNIDEKIRALLKTGGSKTTYLKNNDGTYTYSMESPARNMKADFKLGEETDFTRPDGVVLKSTYNLDGNTLTQKLKDPEGRIMKLVRVFDGDKCTVTVTVEGMDLKATIDYEAV